MAYPPQSQEEADVDTVIVNNVIPFIEDDEPAHVAYPNLIATSSVSHVEALNDMKIRPVKRKRSTAAQEADDDDWEMLGKSDGRDWHGRRGFQEMNVDYFIGIRNKKSRTVKFVEVDRTFSFRPALGPSQWKDDAAEEKDEKRTYVERRKELLQTFGGRKSAKRVARYERDRITNEKVGEDAQAGITAAAEMKERDAKEGISQVAPTSTEWTAPPHDNNAKRPEDAYPMEGLTTPTEMASLETEAQKTIDCLNDPETRENPGWHELVWEQLRNTTILTNISEEERRSRLKAGIYLHYLIVLARCPNNLNYKTQDQVMNEMGVFPPILQCLLNRFSIPDPRSKFAHGERIRRQEDLIRVHSYAVIMWITLLGFKDCRRNGELAEALGIHEPRILLKQAESLGCKVKKSRGQKGPQAYSISLPIPLKFPAVKKRMGRPQGRGG